MDLIRRHLIDVKPDGSFRMDMRNFNYCQGLTMTNDAFAGVFGGPARNPETEIDQRHMDLAASVQAVTEDVMLKMGRAIFHDTGLKHLVLAGGWHSTVGNGRLFREGPFDDI